MLDYAPSEFSRLRLQYNRDQSQAEADNQWYLQYIMSPARTARIPIKGDAMKHLVLLGVCCFSPPPPRRH